MSNTDSLFFTKTNDDFIETAQEWGCSLILLEGEGDDLRKVPQQKDLPARTTKYYVAWANLSTGQYLVKCLCNGSEKYAVFQAKKPLLLLCKDENGNTLAMENNKMCRDRVNEIKRLRKDFWYSPWEESEVECDI